MCRWTNNPPDQLTDRSVWLAYKRIITGLGREAMSDKAMLLEHNHLTFDECQEDVMSFSYSLSQSNDLLFFCCGTCGRHTLMYQILPFFKGYMTKQADVLPVFSCLYLLHRFLSFIAYFAISFPSSPSRLRLSIALLWCYCIAFECPEGCAFAGGPKSSFLLELGPSLWGWGAGGGDGLVDVASHKLWTLTGMGRSRGSHSKWGRSASAAQLAFRQSRSHSYSALSFQYRLPLLTSLIAFSQSLGYVFDESIKTLCIAK